MTRPVAVRPFVRLVAFAALVSSSGALLGACGSSRLYVAQPGPYDAVPDEWTAELAEARSAFEDGRAPDAHAILLPLATERPELVPVRIFLQEIECALLGAGEEVGGFGVTAGADVAASLGDVYRARADANPNPERYILAARLATNAEGALALLEQARAIDPSCVWVYYGIAWWSTRERLYPAARAAVEEAFELDGGHAPTMRLHATHLAGAGETKPAIDCLTRWLERGEASPLIAPTARAEARVDLAALYLLDDDPGAALGILVEIDRTDLVDSARAELVRAVTLDELGERPMALAAARRARNLAPDDPLALVYQALLLKAEGNSTQERQTWELLLAEADEREAARVAARAQGAAVDEDEALDFTELLIRLRARARLSRLNRLAPQTRGPRESPSP